MYRYLIIYSLILHNNSVESEDKNMKLNEHLKQLRTSKNLSVYKLARMTDVSENHIRSIEKGNSQPSVLTLEKLLIALGTNLAEFFNEDQTILYPSELEQELLIAVRHLDKEQAKALIHLATLMNRNE
ncbi:XRE family transcriptional regulator [Hungatella hathewayi]|jgi:transcriptional regulator with XRE-family HTH domain|uniref:XRE family transcriptional regulator n=2 Tax=Lachnospiraceae TaxID=186803 RepID=A0A3E3DH78_9FIRM|nr:XRE family transcriptional regulator [Hungatella hathewayi]